MSERNIVKFTLRNDGNPSYMIKGPSKIIYQIKRGESFEVRDLRDISYFDGRKDICSRDGQKTHEASLQQKSYTVKTPSVRDLLLRNHKKYKEQRDLEAARKMAPATNKPDHTRTEPRKSPDDEKVNPPARELPRVEMKVEQKREYQKPEIKIDTKPEPELKIKVKVADSNIKDTPAKS